jgi:hypothetical protein
MPSTLRRAALLGGLAVALTSLVAAGAAALAVSAASATPIALDLPENGSGAAPLIAYDHVTGTTYVAWTDPVKPAVDLCILPAGQTACEGGAPVLLEDSLFTGANFSGPGGLVVLPGGEVAVIGNTTENGSIAWISPPGGEGFLTGKKNGLQNGGEPISNVSLFYTGGNAVALNGTDVGLLDDYGDKFADTSLTTEAPEIENPNTNQTHPEGQFARKALDTAGSEVAAEPAPPPAAAGSDILVGVGDNYAGPPEVLPGCLNKEGTGDGVSVGKVDGTSKSAGTLNAKGLPGYGVFACSAESPVLAQGGEDGIGLVEQEGDGFDGSGSLFTVDYRPFLATSTGGTFGSPVQLADVTHESLGGVFALDLSEDASTGVYTTWEDGQGLVLDYSSNGGASWGSPVVVPEPPGGVQDNPVIVGVGGGNAEIAYVGNPGTGPQVFLEAVNYQQLALAPTTLTTFQTSGTTTGASITIPAGTVGETDKATVSGANAGTATGTVDYALYSSSSCTSAPVFSGASSVSGGAAAPVTVTSALPAGTYYWRASYSGDSTNEPSTSACGSEVLTVTPPATTPSSEFKVEAIVTSSNGTITITIIVEQSGEATLEVTISTTTLAHSAAVDAKSKKCKHGKIKLKGKCVSATTVVGKTSGKATAGVPLKLTVHLSSKIKNLLKKGKTVHLAGKLAFQSALGGKPTTHTYSLVVKGIKRKHKK